MGVAQHHDAVSGTERQHVAYDYAKRLSLGIHQCLNVISKSFKNILSTTLGLEQTGDSSDNNDVNIVFCPLLNVSQCLEIEGKTEFTVIVYNPLPRPLQAWLRVPVVARDYVVNEAETGQDLIVDYSPVYNETRRIPERADSRAEFNLVFRSDLPSLGFRVYTISKTDRVKRKRIIDKIKETRKESDDEIITIKNEFLQLKFDPNANLAQIDNLETQCSTPITQKLCFYESMSGNNSESKFQASGAYIFRPAKSNDTSLCLTVKSHSLFQGAQFTELHQVFNDWISQTIRLYTKSRHVEFEWQIGPIDVEKDNIGKEIITKFETNLKSNSRFYTDSNGREILQRVRDFRPTWHLNQSEPIAGNYYPINTRIFIRDEVENQKEQRQLTIVNDRTQGGSSVADGQIEIMLHRRILNDDSLGVSEPLNERD
jgi:lysosomal alpha-mannosidase